MHCISTDISLKRNCLRKLCRSKRWKLANSSCSVYARIASTDGQLHTSRRVASNIAYLRKIVPAKRPRKANRSKDRSTERKGREEGDETDHHVSHQHLVTGSAVTGQAGPLGTFRK